MFSAEGQVRLHVIWRWCRWLVPVLLIACSVLDHVGAFGYPGDDWQRFDGRQFTVKQIIDNQSFTIDGATVRLLGVRQQDDERIASQVESRLRGKTVLLKLDRPQTRDSSGQLLAYVYLSPADCWNVDMVRAGLADADVQTPCSMLDQMVVTERERDLAIARDARKRKS
jgi:endonuclease YncB( thermonuclease family)